MNGPQQLLEKILSTATVEDPNGESIKLSANVDTREGEFLRSLVKEQAPKRSLEVGFANGIATLYMCSALRDQATKDHTVIDPNQSTEWKNVGVANLKRAGIDFCTLLEKPSEIALPQLLAEGNKYDLAFIDGWHTFDHALMDFFYIDKMINLNGLIIIDDVSMPSLNKMMRYILSNYANYVYVNHVPDNGRDLHPIRTSIEGAIGGMVRTFFKAFPGRLRRRLVASRLIASDKELHLNASMIAIRKIGPDDRSWYYYNDF